mgnify:CR=1 FL=1
MNFFNNLFTSLTNPKTPNGFVKKFLVESKRKYCQLELFYKEEIILQAESLRHVPIWMEWANVDKTIFHNGIVVHFFIQKKDLAESSIYKRYVLNKERLNMIEFEDEELGIINFTYFFKSSADYMDIAIYMKKVIDNTLQFKENNPQILFNIRYLKIERQN